MKYNEISKYLLKGNLSWSLVTISMVCDICLLVNVLWGELRGTFENYDGMIKLSFKSHHHEISHFLDSFWRKWEGHVVP